MIPLHLVGSELKLLHQEGKLGARLEVRGPLQISANSSPVGSHPPGPHAQADHNRVTDLKLSYQQKGLTLNVKLRDRQVPNRTDLGPDFQLLGRGYGFRGLKGPDSGLANQQQAGQRLFEQSGLAELRYDFAKLGSLRLYGLHRDLGDRNPALDSVQFDAQDPRFNPNGDSSLDFGRNHRQRGWGAELVTGATVGAVRIRGGLSFGTSQDRFQLTPGSQLALNWLAANQPGLVGPGRFLFEDQFETIPLLDEQGNPVYSLDAGSPFPTLRRDRTYGSGVVAATYDRAWGRWKLNAEAGLVSGRMDDQLATLFTAKVRLQHRNIALQLAREANPVTADTLTDAPLTERVDPLAIQDSTRLEWQDRGFSASLESITHRNPFETRLAFPGTQLPYIQKVRFDRAVTRQFSASYRFENVELRWTNSLTFGQGNDANGIPIAPYPIVGSATAQNQIALRASFKPLRNTEAIIGWNYSSGLVGTDRFGDGSRIDSQSLDLELRKGSFRVGITNLFDDRRLISYNQFPGTQFQTGRMIWFSYAAKVR
jgi:hypothetical protein